VNYLFGRKKGLEFQTIFINFEAKSAINAGQKERERPAVSNVLPSNAHISTPLFSENSVFL
jgi:hypothetical protein